VTTLAELPLLSILLVAAAAFLGSLASALTGSGGAIIVSFALAPIIGLAPLVPTVSVAMAVSHAARIGAFRNDVDRRIAAIVLAAALPGAVIGALVYTRLDERTIALTLGIFMLAVVALRRLRPAAAVRLGTGWIVALSFGFGLVSGGTIGGGILVLPILAAAGLAGAALVATDAVIGLALHGVKMVVFGSVSALTRELVILGLVVGIMTIPGAWAARWLLARIPLKVHAGIIDAVIALGGIGFLLQA
jgi:uncharacterized membrane protein YfcA